MAIRITERILDFTYTGSIQSIVLSPGMYCFEVWGAQGGSGNGIIGGKGGYSTGVFSIFSPTTIFVVVGGQGSWSTGTRAEGGFNGGGFAHTSTTGTGAGSGGGCTHIATRDGLLFSLKTFIEDVIIVAGAGGGGCGGNAGNQTGGYGGGLTGENGHNSGYNVATAGTQEGPGNSGNLNNHSGHLLADFGLGGGAVGSGNTWYGGGGGSGLYGGGYGGTHCSGPGGSGFVSQFLEDAKTINGATLFLSPNGVNEIGHSGNGYARITLLTPFDTRKNSNMYQNAQCFNAFDIAKLISAVE